MHRAVGGFGAFNVYARSVIPVPYAKPAGDYSLLIGDWYKTSHRVRLHWSFSLFRTIELLLITKSIEVKVPIALLLGGSRIAVVNLVLLLLNFVNINILASFDLVKHVREDNWILVIYVI